MRPERIITDEGELRDVIAWPTDVVTLKLADHINEHTRQFIERSPFVCVGTSRPGGGLDVSPRGDPPGFVRVIDSHTLLMPERPGDRIADTLTNLLHDPRIALLFLIPGVGDTFRVNGGGRDRPSTPSCWLPSAIEGQVPKLGLLITVQQAYTQCAKALIRSDLWNPEHHIDRSELSELRPDPALAQPTRHSTPTTHDRARAERYARREGLDERVEPRTSSAPSAPADRCQVGHELAL